MSISLVDVHSPVVGCSLLLADIEKVQWRMGFYRFSYSSKIIILQVSIHAIQVGTTCLCVDFISDALGLRDKNSRAGEMSKEHSRVEVRLDLTHIRLALTNTFPQPQDDDNGTTVTEKMRHRHSLVRRG